MSDIIEAIQESPASFEPGVLPTGSGFRAVIRKDGAIVWQCPHVHFTDHSAKACNALAALVKSAA
jgi:hypothetical protein